jgi:hypothetical protein
MFRRIRKTKIKYYYTKKRSKATKQKKRVTI